MIKIKDKSNCCGCHACFNICPVDAIEMKSDEEGFLYPKVNNEKCIDCGMCEKVCPIIKKIKNNNKPIAYACINKDEEIRNKSSSGGIFALIAEWIIEREGIVFGAKFDDEFNVVHSYISKKEEIYKFQGSKYVQSSINSTYKKARDFLEEGKTVLFSGTPCQIEGLYSFLQKNYENLYTQDIICHGVPSPKVWKKYKDFITDKGKEKLKLVEFRNKSNGWKDYSFKYILENDYQHNERISRNEYMKAFLNDLSLRNSCYECRFKQKNRNADITLADFWGIENIDESMYDGKGTSLVIVNSSKGKMILEGIKDKISYKIVNLDEAIKYNSSMTTSALKPKNREKFLKELENMKFDKLVNKCIKKPSLIQRIKEKLRRIIKFMKEK